MEHNQYVTAFIDIHVLWTIIINDVYINVWNSEFLWRRELYRMCCSYHNTSCPLKNKRQRIWFSNTSTFWNKSCTSNCKICTLNISWKEGALASYKRQKSYCENLLLFEQFLMISRSWKTGLLECKYQGSYVLSTTKWVCCIEVSLPIGVSCRWEWDSHWSHSKGESVI